MPLDKNQMRREIRERLRNWAAATKAQASGALVEKLMPLASEGDVVLAFWPLIASEPDIRETLEAWLAIGVCICLPRVEGVNMSAHRVDAFDALLPSDFGVSEPDPNRHPEFELKRIDTILVPGVAFTRDGARMGRGKGHYDRFLPQLKSESSKIGVAFSLQIFEPIPLEPHDIRLDRVLSD